MAFTRIQDNNILVGPARPSQLTTAGGVVSGGADPLAPAAPTLDLVAASDTGSSSTDNITTDTTPDIDFITAIAVVENDVLKIFDNGVQIASHTVTAGEAGSSTVTLGLSALSAGTHSLTATHTIAGPHTSPSSSPLSITIDLTAPTISTAATANNAENTVLAISLTADETVTWSLTGGADQAKFEISGTTLRWASNGTKDFEIPDDADTNNTYIVQVTATDVAGNATNKTITVTVTDVAEGGGTTTWNPADKGTRVALSGGNLTATNNGSTGAAMVRSISSQSSGKYYWEITIGSTGSNTLGVGVCDGSQPLSTGFLGDNASGGHGMGYYSGGGVSVNSSTRATIQTFTSGNVIGIAYDEGNDHIWFRTNGGNWNNSGAADPETNTGGILVRNGSAMAFPMFACVDVEKGTATVDSITANFGATAFANAAPSGFGNL